MSIIAQELIGTSVEVIDAANREIIGLKGKVVDETKHTFTVMTQKGERRIMKKGNVFVFTVSGRKIRIDGEKLEARPEERIRKAK